MSNLAPSRSQTRWKREDTWRIWSGGCCYLQLNLLPESRNTEDVETCVDEEHLTGDRAGEIGGKPDCRPPDVIDGDVALQGGDISELSVQAFEAAHAG